MEARSIPDFYDPESKVQHKSAARPALKTYSTLEPLLLSACRGDDVSDMNTEVLTFLITLTKVACNFSWLLRSLCFHNSVPVTNVTSFANFFIQRPPEVVGYLLNIRFYILSIR
jgi:hypothetical protein